MIGLARPCHRSGVRLVGMALSFALSVRLVDDPPCATFPAAVAALDFVLPNPIVATALAADLIGPAPG